MRGVRRPQKLADYWSLKLVGITVLAGALQVLISGFTEMLLLDQSRAWYMPWMFVSAIFLHSGIGHLFLNMLGLGLFGSILEKIIGSRRFLLVYFTAGIAANLVAVNFYPLSLGASGAVFGILGTLALLRPHMTIWLSYIPMPMWIAIFVWAAIDIIGVFFPDGVGNIAHLVGLFSGILFGLYWRRRFARRRRRIGNVEVIPDRRFRDWENSFMR
ncbi:MAG: rhomboid family intramembrane serine protease [Nanoarchaeota archaeon]